MTIDTFLKAGFTAMLQREETKGQFSFQSLCVCSLAVHGNYIVQMVRNYRSDGLRNCPFLLSNKHIEEKMHNKKMQCSGSQHEQYNRVNCILSFISIIAQVELPFCHAIISEIMSTFFFFKGGFPNFI